MDTNQNRSGLIFGTILIIIGALFFVGQVFNVMNWGNYWPLFIIGIGVAFFVGMLLGGKSLGALAIPGSIITMGGLILLAQNVFGWWETWSYAWGLVLASVGVGIAIYGHRSQKPESVKGGWDLARVGLILFLIFGAIFEFFFSFIGVSGRQGQLFWALLIAALGLVQFLWRAFRLITKPAEVDDNGRDLLGPFILMGIGLLAALAVQGFVPGFRLLSLVSLWPLLLIAAGFQLIIGRKLPWLGAIAGVLLLAGVLVFALYGDRLGLRLSTPNWFNSISFGDGDWDIRETVKGNGVMGESTVAVTDFDRVALESIGTLVVVQGDQESLTILAEENLLQYIEANVRGDELEIGVERGIGLQPTEDITYQLTVKTLERVSLSGAGKLEVDELDVDRLTLESSGVGSFTITDLQAQDLNVEISGTGSATVAGMVSDVQIEISGAGSFTGDDLQVQEAQVDISGLGNARLWVEDQLNVTISGAGSVSYFGDPKVDQNTFGAGMVNKLGDK
jgi:hypothetical protein